MAQAGLSADAEWRPMSIPGYMARLGPLLAARESGDWLYALDTGSDHANPSGQVHGGVISGLVDHAVALVAWEEAGRRPVVTVQLDTRFLRPVPPGARLVASARLRHRSRSMLFLEAEVTAQDALVATASSIVKLARDEADAGARP